MSLLITMSIAGTISVVLYYLSKYLGKGSIQQYRMLLRTAAFFFLCPIQLLKYKFPETLFTFRQCSENKIYLKRNGYKMFSNLDGTFFLKPVWLLVLLFIWFFTVIGVLIFQFMKYKKLKNSLIQICHRNIQYSRNVLVIGWKKVLCLKSNFIQVPFTIGIFKHWIFLPEAELSEDEAEMIMLHEETHIKNRDLLFKVICFGICLLHWFNPFAWLLLYEYDAVSESICDEQVTQRFTTMEQRKKYAILLVNMTAKKSKIPFANYFSKQHKGTRKMKKRIDDILYCDKKKTKFLTITWIIACILSTSTVFAYSMPASWNKELSEIITESEYLEEKLSDNIYDVSDSEMIFFSDDELESNPKNLVENYIIHEEYDFSQADIIFIDDTTGIQITVPDMGSEKEICTHNMTSGKMVRHVINNNGGCLVKTYKAEKCIKCNYYKLGELLSETKFTTCPH